MPHSPVHIPFGPKPSREPFYKFRRATVDEATIRKIACADYGEGADVVFGLLATTLRTGELPTDDENWWEFQECVALSSHGGDLFSLFLLLESEAADLGQGCNHNHALANLVWAALDHSHDAASALAAYVSWLAVNDPTDWPRSFHVLAMLLLLVSIRCEDVGPKEVAFLERLFHDELRANASEVIGYDLNYSGYEGALEMIANRERTWLLCLDTDNYDHSPWIRLADRVLEGHADKPELERLRNRLCLPDRYT